MTQQKFRALAHDGVVGEIVRQDGTIWSHAATLGTRIKGFTFTIDRDTVENFVRVFMTGWPRKVPVDYEHGTTSGATDTGHPVPKAGDVVEMRGVFAADDFEGELLETAQKLAQRVDRKLDDPQNFGLWVRWRPTARALQMIKDREYTEMSIVFVSDLEHNVTGESQGPALLCIALTNLPFLDDMLPVAASRGTGGQPAEPANGGSRYMPDTGPSMRERFAVMLGRVFGTEQEAAAAMETRFNELTTKVRALEPHKVYSDAVSLELGEKDPTKATEKIREMKQVVETARASVEASAKQARESTADSILTKHEKRLSPARKQFLRPQLITELTAGKKAGETETEKFIQTLPELGVGGQQSATDTGRDAPTDRDSRINERALSIMKENEDLKELARKDRSKAFKQALRLANAEIPAETVAA